MKFQFSCFPPALLTWLTNRNCIYLRCTAWCFDIHIHCEKMTTVKLTTHQLLYLVTFLCMCVVRTIEICFLSKFQVYFNYITMLYMRSPELIHLITKSFYPLTNIFPFYSPPSTEVTTILVSCYFEFNCFRLSI